MNRARAFLDVLNRHRRIAIGAVVVLAVIAGGLVFAVTRPEPVAVATPTPTPTAEPTPTPSPTPSPTPTPTPTPVPTPTPIPLDEALLNQRITVLFAGLDANDDRRTRAGTFNTDAIVVASVDAAHTQISTVALPRDTVNIPLANGLIYTGKVNSLYASYGIEGLRGALETTYGIEIDYYVLLDMSDFGRIITALGGVQVDVPTRMIDGKIGLDLQAGTQRLSGNDALRYVRTRVDTDYGRAGRQQQLVIALTRELVNPAQPVDLLALAGSLRSLETDLPLDKLPTLLEIGRRSAAAEIVSQTLRPPRFALFEGIEDGPRGWIMIPNLAEMRAYTQAVMGGE
jgi:LCP family protein required for cell wall assembly